MAFRSFNFLTLRDAFLTRYGEPTSYEKPVLKNRMGAEFQDEILTWNGPTMTISLQKYSSTVTAGGGSLTKHDYRNEVLRHRREQRKGAAKDL